MGFVRGWGVESGEQTEGRAVELGPGEGAKAAAGWGFQVLVMAGRAAAGSHRGRKVGKRCVRAHDRAALRGSVSWDDMAWPCHDVSSQAGCGAAKANRNSGAAQCGQSRRLMPVRVR